MTSGYHCSSDSEGKSPDADVCLRALYAAKFSSRKYDVFRGILSSLHGKKTNRRPTSKIGQSLQNPACKISCGNGLVV